MKKQLNTVQLALTGLMAALVFVASMFSFPIPLPVGPATRLHLGNVFCLLSGMVLGPVFGGLSAGIGSFFFDLLNPQYLADSPFTFLFKFLMAFVCARICRLHDQDAGNVKLNFLGAICGSLTYIVLYVGKGLVENLLLRMEWSPALLAAGTKFAASSMNAIVAVIASVPLYFVIRSALKRGNLLGKIS